VKVLFAFSLLTTARINSTKPRPDLIFVGTQSNLLAYDVERNADSFFVEVQDGVNAMVVGRMSPSGKPLILTGGNCSILGFDAKGVTIIANYLVFLIFSWGNVSGIESFWTVTGDNVSSLALCDAVNPISLHHTILNLKLFVFYILNHRSLDLNQHCWLGPMILKYEYLRTKRLLMKSRKLTKSLSLILLAEQRYLVN